MDSVVLDLFGFVVVFLPDVCVNVPVFIHADSQDVDQAAHYSLTEVFLNSL